jgi:hypothetical protein
MQKIKSAILLGLLPIFTLADGAWIGNGSVMSAYKNNVSDKVYSNPSSNAFGITKDMSIFHDLSSNNVAFFQWFVNSSSCKRLKIYATDAKGKYYITPKANITVGPWYSRSTDRTFERVTLPFIISNENVKYSEWFKDKHWIVTAVEMVDGTDSGNIYAQCTDEVEDIQIDFPYSFGHKVKVDDGYVWNGNASIISAYFRSQYNNWSNPSTGSNPKWPYGLFKDVSTFSPRYDKQVVFFQWQRSDECSELKIDLPDAPKSQKDVNLMVKEWNESPFIVYNEDVTLPYIVKNKDKKLWTVLGVYSDESFDKQQYVEASCCTAPSYKNLFKIKYPSCQQKWDMFSRFKYEKVLTAQRNLITAKINGADTGHEKVKLALELTDYIVDPKGKTISESAKRTIKFGLESLFPNGNNDVIDGLSGIISDVAIQSIEGSIEPHVLIEKKATQIFGIFNDLLGSFQLDGLTEEMYTSLIVTYYLEEYYAWGGDATKVAVWNGLARNSSLEKVIDAIANKHGNVNNWYETEYHRDDVKKMVQNIVNNVIPFYTEECLSGGCR